ncbi:MAG: GldM family protein, partial [Bacteroidales bacterium]
NGEYIVRPEKPGKAMITVSIKGKTIQQSQFRVKTVPDPVAAIKTSNGYFFGGEITKDELLAADGITAVMKYFDFDLSFDIVEFTVLYVIQGFVSESISRTDKFTDKQKDMIKSLKSGSNLYIQDIKCKGPDGKLRNLGTIYFKLK